MPGVPGNVVHGEWGGGMGTTCLLRQHSGHGAGIRGVDRTVCGKIKMKLKMLRDISLEHYTPSVCWSADGRPANGCTTPLAG